VVTYDKSPSHSQSAPTARFAIGSATQFTPEHRTQDGGKVHQQQVCFSGGDDADKQIMLTTMNALGILGPILQNSSPNGTAANDIGQSMTTVAQALGWILALCR
jgi:hypothetical protein